MGLKEYPLFFPHPGWSEQNPEDWFTQSVEGMKELTEGIDRSKVAGIGFGGQMHGLVTLDGRVKKRKFFHASFCFWMQQLLYFIKKCITPLTP